MSLREILLLPGISTVVQFITGGRFLLEDSSRLLLEDGSFLTLE
jgi:hypothetical protein